MTDDIQSRAEFEELANSMGYGVLRGRGETYASSNAQIMWAAWQASAALHQGEIVALSKDNKRLRDALERLLMEITQAHFNPNWFTGGKSSADRHITTELRRAKQALEGNV